MELTIWGIPVRGVDLDSRMGCMHYRSELDIIAIKFNCCRTYYPCFYCHELEADHSARIWPRAEFDQKVVLCGACGSELTIRKYLDCQGVCPACRTHFNPGCARHHHLYFETSGAVSIKPDAGEMLLREGQGAIEMGKTIKWLRHENAAVLMASSRRRRCSRDSCNVLNEMRISARVVS